MSWAAVGSPIFSNSSSFSLTPGGVGDLILLQVTNESNTTVTATSLSSSNATWVPLTNPFPGTVKSFTDTIFAGKVTSTSAATLTVTWSGTTPATLRVVGQEFSSTKGSWSVDGAQGNLDGGGAATWPALTPTSNGDLYFGWCFDSGTAIAGTTSGYTYYVDANGNGMAYNTNCPAGTATAPTWGDAGFQFGTVVLVRETVPSDLLDQGGNLILDQDGSDILDQLGNGNATVAGLAPNVTVAGHLGNIFGNAGYYTENLNPNPSVETDLSGYVALVGTTLSQETTQGFSGRSSMKVVTDGTRSGEGFTAPQVPAPGTGSGSMSFYLMGATGTLTVSAISGSTATVIAQTSVTLSGGDYQRVVLSGLSLTVGQPMYLLVQTNTAQALTFWVDAFQYEMNAAPHPYIDGSFPNCVWEGTAQESASFQPFQFTTGATGGMYLEGTASPVTEGEVFTTSASGSMLLSGSDTGTLTINPTGALSDFGIWTSADMDPAVSYIEWSNAGASSGSNAWNRVYALAYPPKQALASDGSVLWPRAAYAAIGFTFKAMANNNQQALADVQLERMPVVPGTTPVPSAYQPPRQITTTIKPTRLNFCPNPSIETSTNNWGVIGSATLSKDATVSKDGHSLKVVVNANNDGATVTLADLIVGDTYIVSAYVQGGAGLQDVQVTTSSGGTILSSQQGVPYGGDFIDGIGYGQGPYGGVQASTTDMPTGQWFRPSFTFTAQQSSVQLGFRALAGSDVSYPTSFWVDQVLVEEGDTLGVYFDGNTGTDYSWETGGTSGETRSYYYQRQNVAAGAVTKALAEHTPLGILAATPAYSSPYSQ